MVRAMVALMVERGKIVRKPHPQSPAGPRKPFIYLMNDRFGVLFPEAKVSELLEGCLSTSWRPHHLEVSISRGITRALSHVLGLNGLYKASG